MFWDNLDAACKGAGIKVTPLLQELSISTGSIAKWKQGGEISSRNLMKISERLGVSVDFLLYGADHSSSSAPESISYDEQLLLKMYRSLPANQQGRCFSYIQGMYDALSEGEKSAG